MDGQTVLLDFFGFLQQIGIGLEAGGQPLHLTVDHATTDGLATLHVVIGQLRARHHVFHRNLIAVATGTP